jgi:large subunit ribosomal protein L3
MQFWHRRRAPRMTARIRTWVPSKDAKLLGFAGYKVGMTHIIHVDNRSTSLSKGDEISAPVTVIECPPIRVIGIKTLVNRYGGKQVSQFKWADKLEKHLARAMNVPKIHKAVELKTEGVIEVRVLAQTQPHLINLKKTPEIIELGIGGKVEDQLKFANDILGKEVKASEVFSDGAQVDAHSVTKGHGLQGPVARHGIMIRSHKAEKTKRGPATLGPWDGNRSYRVAHQGQTGFHRRTELNKWVVRVEAKPEEVTPKGGFVHYGLATGSCMLLRGSVGGAVKRLITMTPAMRPRVNIPKQAPEIVYTSLHSKQ